MRRIRIPFYGIFVSIYKSFLYPQAFIKRLRFIIPLIPAFIRYFDFGFLFRISYNIDENFLKIIFARVNSACISVTDDCNYRCNYCFEHPPLNLADKDKMVPARDYYMPLYIYKRLIDELCLLDTKLICLAGAGEPFMHPDFMDMVRYAKQKKLKCFITTNGSFIDEPKARELVELGVEEIYISLSSSSEENFQKITNADKENFFKAKTAARTISDYKRKLNTALPYTTITNVINAENYFEVTDMVKLASELKADAVGFHRMFFCQKRRRSLTDQILNTQQIQELKSFLVEAIRLAGTKPINNNIPFFMKLLEEGYLVQEARYISRIKEAVNDLFVFADGTITLLDYPGAIGCIKGGSFFNIWFSPAYCLLRMKAKKIRYHKKLECISFCRGCDKKSIIEQDIQYKYCHG